MLTQSTESLKLMQDLFASYEEGVKSISPVFSVAAMFLGANIEQETEKNQLRETLSRNGHLRKKDFDQMLDSIAETRHNGAREIYVLLRDYIVGQHETISQLSGYFAEVRFFLSDGDFQKIKLTVSQIKTIIARQETARRELENKLIEFEKERDEIQSGIKCLLSKGRELQVRDFKEMLAKIKNQRRNRIEENKQRRETVGQMLAGYKMARQGCRCPTFDQKNKS